jgi:rhomboid protease GluP
VDAATVIDAYRREANFARALRKPTPMTWALLGSLLAVHLVFLFVEHSALTPAGEGGLALLFGAKINSLVWKGQSWRLVSSMFLHGGFLHLLFNGYALYLLGPLLERLHGSRRFLILYLFSGLAGAAASVMFTDGPSVGASGAIFGMLGALVVFGLKFRTSLPPRVARALGVGLLPWVAINLVIGLIPGLPIDNAAHIGGLIAGTALAVTFGSALAGKARGLRDVALELAFALCLLVIAAGLVLMLHQVASCGDGGSRFFACYPADLLAR